MRSYGPLVTLAVAGYSCKFSEHGQRTRNSSGCWVLAVNAFNKVSRGETICPADGTSTGAYRWCSHLANAYKVAQATVFGHFRWTYGHANQWIRLTARGFLLVFYIVTIALKCIVFELSAWNRQTNRQTDGQIAASLNAPAYRMREHDKRMYVCV